MPSVTPEREREPLRIIVVGGGLGGLTLGQLLYDIPEVRVKVYERSATMDDRLTGYRVMLSSFTLQNLKGKLWSETWGQIALSIGMQPEGGQKLRFMKGNGDTMFDWENEEVRDQYSVSRYQLRQGLLHKSDGFLILGKTFQRYEELEDGRVRVYFSDGTSDECDLLVGADGANSRVKKQLLPATKVRTKDMAIIHFKIPFLPETIKLLEAGSGTMYQAFCRGNQYISVHSWQNPLRPWTNSFTKDDIDPEESYIMFGCGSPVDKFLNRTKAPDQLSSRELKEECIARVRNNPEIHANFKALARYCITNTAYIHMVKMADIIKPWDSPNIVLLGDAVFNMPNMLGKGANCAMLDAVSLAETLSSEDFLDASKRHILLRRYLQDNINRRIRERHRSTLMHKLVFFGNNKLKEFCREKGLSLALTHIERLGEREYYDGTFSRDDRSEELRGYSPMFDDMSNDWASAWDDYYEQSHPNEAKEVKEVK